jgi:hypothetical protein
MAILSQPLKRWKNWRARSNAHFINSSTTANLPKRRSSDDIAWGSAGKEARYLNKLRRLLSKSDEEDRKLLLYMAQKMAHR